MWGCVSLDLKASHAVGVGAGTVATADPEWELVQECRGTGLGLHKQSCLDGHRDAVQSDRGCRRDGGEDRDL